MKKILLIVLLFSSFSFAQMYRISYPLVFDTATVTNTLNFTDYRVAGYSFAGIQLDSANKATSYTIKVSSDGVDYGDLKDIDNTAIGVFTVGANSKDVHTITLQQGVQFNYMYIESDSTETCTIKAILWKGQ